MLLRHDVYNILQLSVVYTGTTAADVVTTPATSTTVTETTTSDDVTTDARFTTAAAMTTQLAVVTTGSPCGHIEEFSPPAFTPGSCSTNINAVNSDAFDKHFYHIRNHGDTPVLRVTIPAGESRMISSNTAGLWFYTTVGGTLVPLTEPHHACYVIF